MTPIEDTHLFIDGPNIARSYGRQDKLFVQHGSKLTTKPGQEPKIPTSYAIMKFNLKNVQDFPDRRRWPDDMQVKLQLTHEPQNDEAGDDNTPSRLEVYRMPNNYDLEVESWTGSSFTSAPKYTREGILVGQATVPADMESFEIDIKPAFYLSDDKLSTGHYKDDQVLLMLAVNDGNPRSGVEFGSRESDTPPKIQFLIREAVDLAP
jgi:hypothetical protein